MTSTVRYSTDLSSWTDAVHDGTNIIITESNDFYGAGIDKVETKIRKSLVSGNKIFLHLKATTNP